MKIQSLLRTPNEWIRASGPEAEIVFSSRVRLARNLRGFVFPPWSKEPWLKRVAIQILQAVKVNDYFRECWIFDMSELSPIERKFLLERHLISQEFMRGEKAQVLVALPGEIVSMMINEEDHLRIQTILSGLQLMEAWRICDRIDDELAGTLEYAFSPEKGYLTSCLTNVGTGLRASCMLHLPALVHIGKIDEVLKNVSKWGLVTRGFYGEGSKAQGDFFQISNQVTLGFREEDILSLVERIVQQVVKQEKKAREYLLQQDGVRIADKVGRAYGILSHAHLMDSEEAMRLLSRLRLGVCLGLVPGNLPVATLNDLFVCIGPAQIQVKEGRLLDAISRDKVRARVIREKLTNVH